MLWISWSVFFRFDPTALLATRFVAEVLFEVVFDFADRTEEAAGVFDLPRGVLLADIFFKAGVFFALLAEAGLGPKETWELRGGFAARLLFLFPVVDSSFDFLLLPDSLLATGVFLAYVF